MFKSCMHINNTCYILTNRGLLASSSVARREANHGPVNGAGNRYLVFYTI